MGKLYRAGTTVIQGMDAGRDEILGSGTGKRIIVARLYYPAVVKDEKRVEIPKKTVGEMYEAAQIVSGKKFPLIVYNHGYGAYVEANNNLCCQLAANGFVVASVGHPYETADIALTDGSRIGLDKRVKKLQIQPRLRGMLASFGAKSTKGSTEEQYKRFHKFQLKYCAFLNERLPEWAADVGAVVDILKREYSENIDFERGIGLTGHSFGGCLAYYMCMNFDEYVCGANIDGAIFGDYERKRMKRPFMQICNKGNVAVVSRALLYTDASVVYEVFDRVKHLGFTDMSYYINSKLMMGAMPSEEVNDRLVKLHLDFFRKYLCESSLKV